jgi:hypothetical protein
MIALNTTWERRYRTCLIGIGTWEQPYPPYVDEALSEAEMLQQLANWYTSAVEYYIGGQCWAFRRQAAYRTQYASCLKKALEWFKTEHIRPAAWIGWSAQIWKHYNGADSPTEQPARKARTKYPPPSWVFGVARMQKRVGWFVACSLDYDGGCVFYSNSAYILLERYQSISREMLFVDTSTWEGRVRHDSIWEKYLPRIEEARLLAAAKDEVITAKLKTTLALAECRWLWGKPIRDL